MIIDSVTIQNLKSFNGENYVDRFKGINLFIGQNGSGKTNVILALYLIKGLHAQEYPLDFIKDCVFDHEYNKQISIDLQIIPSDKEKKEILNRFITINPQLSWLTHENKFLSRMSYLTKLQEGELVEERIAVSFKSDKAETVLRRELIDGKPIQSSLQLVKVLSKVQSLDQIDLDLVNALSYGFSD